jgi:hypothetical protein
MEQGKYTPRKSHWHREYYAKKLTEIVDTTGHLCREASCSGWEIWFKANHPELYAKYEAAVEMVIKLWGDMARIEEFKKAVETEVQAYAFAIPKYIALQEVPA